MDERTDHSNRIVESVSYGACHGQVTIIGGVWHWLSNEQPVAPGDAVLFGIDKLPAYDAAAQARARKRYLDERVARLFHPRR